MRLLETHSLEPGMVLASPVYSRGGRILLRENVALTESYIARIGKLDIQSIYIFDELSKDISTEEVIDRKHLMRAYNAMRKKNYDLCVAAASCIVHDLLTHAKDLPNMRQLQVFDNYTFNHSIHVAVLCTLVGMELGLPEESLDKLALSGMIHDIGKEKLPAEIIKKKGRLTEEEYEKVKEHPRLGYEMVKDLVSIPAVVKHAILFHHENEDGSGYPNGRKGNEIHLFTRIVHICDVYDAMVSKRSYKDEICPSEVIGFITEQAGCMFDEKMVKVFKCSIYPYPTGEMVVLSDGREALVRKNHKGYPDRPDVILKNTGQVIELRNTAEISVQKGTSCICF